MPIAYTLLFLFACVWAAAFLYLATRSWKVLGATLLLGAIQALLAFSGFYEDTATVPPRAMLLLAPAMGIVAVVAILNNGRRLMREASMSALVLLHVCRIPVEVTLHGAWQQGLVPQAMTYEGNNFDILSGISAILIWLYLRRSAQPSKTLLVGWNLLCLGLLFNIVITAVLSIPGPLQMLNQETPNRLVLLLPYVLLPAIVVPAVLFAHMCALLKLLGGRHS
ncbi:MAG: hypothetical protein ABI599_15760 [Flavobacteriales bacterium]